MPAITTTLPHAPRRERLLGLVCVSLLAFALPARADCPEPPQPVRNLDIARYYSDAKNSVVDPEKLEAAREATAPLTEFVGTVAKQSDAAVLKSHLPGRLSAARCTLAWLSAWAKGAAYLGSMSDYEAEYQRKWDIAGLAIAYL